MLDLLEGIAARSQSLIDEPSEGKGRECYAFSVVEDRVFNFVQSESQKLFDEAEVLAEDYEIKTDAIGNLFVTIFGENREEIVMSGSHIDSVLKGGKFDGVAGVNSAFNFLKKLVKGGKKPAKNYTFAVFRSEEASPKTGVSWIGSRVATGIITPEKLNEVPYTLDDGTTTTLREFIHTKHGSVEGAKKWEAILDEIKNPPIEKNKIVAYEELHIEQSAVCDHHGVDVGVVVDGIGGSVRETVTIPLKADLTREVEVTTDKPQKRYNLHFEGQEAHTGGTPPNPTEFKEPGSMWYRKDALMGASHFLKALFKSDLASGLKITELSVPQQTGFTTVPKEQTVEILVPSELSAVFEAYLSNARSDVAKDLEVNLSWKSEEAPTGKIRYFDSAVLASLEIPFFVENIIRETVLQQIAEAGGGVGRVRGTVTDFRIDENNLKFNLDRRDVDTKAIEAIVDQITQKVREVAGRLVDATSGEVKIDLISRTPFTPLDSSEVAAKVRIAKAQGLSFIKIPSLPGHDAASIGKASIPITMTFVRHDGLSHGSKETMPVEHYQKAEALSHAYLAEKLGLVLSN